MPSTRSRRRAGRNRSPGTKRSSSRSPRGSSGLCSTPPRSAAAPRALDVASGPGHVAAGAAGRGASVIGVDIADGCSRSRVNCIRSSSSATATQRRCRFRRVIRRRGRELRAAARGPPRAGGRRVRAGSGPRRPAGSHGLGTSPSEPGFSARSSKRWRPREPGRRRTSRSARPSSGTRTTRSSPPAPRPTTRRHPGDHRRLLHSRAVSRRALAQGLLGGTVRVSAPHSAVRRARCNGDSARPSIASCSSTRSMAVSNSRCP